MLSLARLGGVGGAAFDGVRRWDVALGPYFPGSALRSRNLSCGLLRQWREHVKPWHMVAWVTCSRRLSLIFRPSEQTCPTQCDTCTAPPVPLWEHPLFTAWELLVHHASLHDHLCRFHSPEFIPTNDVLSGEISVFVCLLSVSADKRLAGPLPADLHPSTALQLQPGKPDFQVSHPHALDCCPLTCANIKERESERERAGEREKQERSEMEKYPSLWLLGGVQRRIAHSWANLHRYRTSPVHFSLLCFLS